MTHMHPCSYVPLHMHSTTHVPVQVLCATKVSQAGVANLNKLLQPVMSPLAGTGQRPTPFGFSLGDRVLQVGDAWDSWGHVGLHWTA